ncbi:MAG: 50S ribosomal protein L35 [Lentisphaeraceae bacterium]|nr:50S ribosomal protein L35 [Lentisphaeraceae bacterium]MCM8543154.1 50S ribosomal protein L35 [Lentisphaeraceae bacterium]
MPKQKTRKCVAKRLKQTSTGKFMHNSPGKRHILTKKSAKRKNRLGKAKVLSDSELNRVKSSLPYGLK